MAANGTNGRTKTADGQESLLEIPDSIFDAPESLFHVMRTITDYADDMSGATRTTDILGTFTSLASAKNAARGALASEGYIKDDFEILELKDETSEEEWKHGDGCLVFAKAPRGQEFDVRIDTKPNVLKLEGNESGEVEGHLHYVLQTTVDYNNDRIGGIQHTEVEGTYPTRKDAYAAAHTVLLDNEVTKDSFEEYDEKEQFEDEWPYGDEVLVRAVGQTGENFYVAVKAQPHSHKEHACSHHGGKKCDCPRTKTDEDCNGKACKPEGCEASEVSQ